MSHTYRVSLETLRWDGDGSSQLWRQWWADKPSGLTIRVSKYIRSCSTVVLQSAAPRPVSRLFTPSWTSGPHRVASSLGTATSSYLVAFEQRQPMSPLDRNRFGLLPTNSVQFCAEPTCVAGGAELIKLSCGMHTGTCHPLLIAHAHTLLIGASTTSRVPCAVALGTC